MVFRNKIRSQPKDAPAISPTSRPDAALTPQDTIRILLEEQRKGLNDIKIDLEFGLSFLTRRITVVEFKKLFEGNANFIKYILGNNHAKLNENSGDITCTYAHVVGLTEILPFPEVNVLQNYTNALSQVNGGAGADGINIKKLKEEYDKQIPLIQMYPKFFNYSPNNQALAGRPGDVCKVNFESSDQRARSIPTLGYGKLLEFTTSLEFDQNGAVINSSESE